MALETASQPTEHSPLLRPSTSNNSSSPQKKKASIFLIITILILILFSLEFGDELIQPGQLRIFESIYCRKYYEIHDPSKIGSDGRGGVKEEYCKNSVIQGQVAMLKGWQVTFDAVGMFIFAIPWGYFADTYGRRPTLFILLTSFWLRAAWVQLVCYLGQTLPLRLVWLSSLHTIIGGSSVVATAMMYTIVSDVMPEARRVSIFFRLSAASVTTQFLSPLLGAYLMRWNPWIPMLLGLGVQIIPILLVLFIPETLNYLENAPEESTTTSSSSSTCSAKGPSLWKKSLDGLKDSFSFLSSDPRMMFIMPAFALHLLIINRDILRQYISTRYHVSLSSATVLVSVRSGLMMLLCLFLLPAINHLFRTHWHIPPKRSDLLLSRFSCVAMALGFFLIGLAPSIPLLVAAMVVNTLGFGLILFLRSLLTSLVEPHHIARVNTFVGIFDTIGLMGGSPGLAWLFEKGVDLGGAWMGLPFLVCAGGVAVVGIILAGIAIGDDGDRSVEGGGDDV